MRPPLGSQRSGRRSRPRRGLLCWAYEPRLELQASHVRYCRRAECFVRRPDAREWAVACAPLQGDGEHHDLEVSTFEVFHAGFEHDRPWFIKTTSVKICWISST